MKIYRVVLQVTDYETAETRDEALEKVSMKVVDAICEHDENAVMCVKCIAVEELGE